MACDLPDPDRPVKTTKRPARTPPFGAGRRIRCRETADFPVARLLVATRSRPSGRLLLFSRCTVFLAADEPTSGFVWLR